MILLITKIEYDFLNGTKFKYYDDGSIGEYELEQDEMFDMVKEGQIGIDELPDAYNDITTLETIYRNDSPNEQIAWKILDDINSEDDVTDLDDIYLAETYGEDIFQDIVEFISTLYSTDDILSIIEDDIAYKTFVVDEVDEVINKILELSKSYIYEV